MTYELVGFISDYEARNEFLMECVPFFDVMYTQEEADIFGKEFFRLDYWFYVWDRKGGFFLTKRNAKGEMVALGIVTQYNDIWHNRNRLEVNRYAISGEIEDPHKETQEVLKYLIDNKELIGYDFLYYILRDGAGNEHKLLRYPEP